MTNVRQLGLPQWRKLAEKPENRCLVPLTEFCEFTPEKHDLGDGKPPLKGEMWFQVVDQAVFAVAGFWQPTKEGNGFTMVTCDPNELVAPIHPKAMITILSPEYIDTWLRGTYDEVLELQRPFASEKMTVRGPIFPTRRPEHCQTVIGGDFASIARMAHSDREPGIHAALLLSEDRHPHGTKPRPRFGRSEAEE